ALVRERAVRAEQIRAIDERLEHAELALRVVPAILRRRNPVQHAGDLGHTGTSSANRSRASLHASVLRGSYVVGAKDAATTSRASASEPISPSDIACTSRFPSSVASSGPARTGRPHASAVQRQSSSLRAPPPTTWIS